MINIMKLKVSDDNKFLVIVDSTMNEYDQLEFSFTKKVGNYFIIKKKLPHWDGEIKFIDRFQRIPIGLWQEVKNVCDKFHFPLQIEGLDKLFNLNHNFKEFEEWVSDYFKDKNVAIRFIERMPFFDNNNAKTFVSSDKLIEILRQKGTLRRNENVDTKVAQMFELLYLDKYNIKIGVIPPITHNFCSKCNRLRLTCDGFLKTCLHSPIEYDLKSPYRMDMGDEALKDIILKAVSEKPQRHNINCAADNSSGCKSITSGRGMSKIGG